MIKLQLFDENQPPTEQILQEGIKELQSTAKRDTVELLKKMLQKEVEERPDFDELFGFMNSVERELKSPLMQKSPLNRANSMLDIDQDALDEYPYERVYTFVSCSIYKVIFLVDDKKIEVEQLKEVPDLPCRSYINFLLDGNLLITGGLDCENKIKLIDSEGVVEDLCELMGDHYAHRAIVYGSELYILGGKDSTDKVTGLCEKIDLMAGNRGQLQDMPIPVLKPAVHAYSGKIYVFGGKNKNEEDTNQIQIYDIEKNMWIISDQTMPAFASGLSCVYIQEENIILLFGKALKKTLSYDFKEFVPHGAGMRCINELSVQPIKKGNSVYLFDEKGNA